MDNQVNNAGLIALNEMAQYTNPETIHRLPARFWSKVMIPEGTPAVVSRRCWLWTGPMFGSAAGQFTVGRKTLRAHRVAYMLSLGPIPEGAHVIRRCGDPLCVNPSHLTLKQTTLRAHPTTKGGD
jgi:hypothetical protein